MWAEVMIFRAVRQASADFVTLSIIRSLQSFSSSSTSWSCGTDSQYFCFVYKGHINGFKRNLENRRDKEAHMVHHGWELRPVLDVLLQNVQQLHKFVWRNLQQQKKKHEWSETRLHISTWNANKGDNTRLVMFIAFILADSLPSSLNWCFPSSNSWGISSSSAVGKHQSSQHQSTVNWFKCKGWLISKESTGSIKFTHIYPW